MPRRVFRLQTLSNLYMAMEHDLAIIPVINKIDLPSADVELVKDQMEKELGLDPELAILCSAKEGKGIDEVVKAIVERIPEPKGSPANPLAALLFDAHYDAFRGVIVSCRVFEGTVRPGDIIRFMSNQTPYKVEEVGIFRLTREPKESLSAGEVGYIISGVKTISVTRIGDTITLERRPAPAPLPGFKDVKPVVFSSLYPISSEDYQSLLESLEKYKLNDAALVYQKTLCCFRPRFRCGFLYCCTLKSFRSVLKGSMTRLSS
jgi:GTP-binding protein LepA